MKESKQRIGGIAINWVTIFLQVVISLFFIPFFLKTVGDKQYGLYSFSTSIIAWIDTLMVAIASAYYKFLTREKKNGGEQGEARACGVFFKIFILISVLVLVVGLLFDLFLYLGIVPLNEYNPTEKNQICFIVLMSIISTAVSCALTVKKSYHYYKQKYIIIYSFSLAQIILQTILSIVALKFGFGVIAVAAVHFGVAIIFTCVLSLLSKVYLKEKITIRSSTPEDKEYRKALFKEILVFSSFVIISTVVDMLNKSLDKILLGFYNADSVSTYQLAYTIPSYLISITSILSVVNVQRINEAYYHGNGVDDLNKVFLRVSKIQTIVTFLLVGGFLIVGNEFVRLWLDEGRIQVYYISCILMLTYSITCSNALGVVARRIQNCHIKASIIYLGIALSNVAFSLLFINVFSKENAIWACVLGTVVTYLVGHYIVMQIYDSKITKLKISSFLKTFFFYAIASVIMYVVIKRTVELSSIVGTINLFLFKGSLYVILYFAFVCFIERKELPNVLYKIKSKILKRHAK